MKTRILFFAAIVVIMIACNYRVDTPDSFMVPGIIVPRVSVQRSMATR